LQFVWEKPVLAFYRERFERTEIEPFLVVKARKLVVSKKEGATKFKCVLEDFFPIMGKLDQISSEKGRTDRYVLCWFDDTVDNFGKAFRRLTGVTFQDGIKCVTDKKGKILCNTDFIAKHAKLE
jgi:hypothetical protein